MFEWAMGSLYHTCRYLNQHYGRDSCFVEWGRWGPGDFYGNHSLIFEPPQEQPSDAPCPCEEVRRWVLVQCQKCSLPSCKLGDGVFSAVMSPTIRLGAG